VKVRVKIRYFAFRKFTFRCCAFSLKCAFAICAFRSFFSLKKPFADMLFAQRTPYPLDSLDSVDSVTSLDGMGAIQRKVFQRRVFSE
jgi:hypothetical protein